MPTVNWDTTPSLDHSAEAQHFLGLTMGKKRAAKLVTKLATSDVKTYKAKDILRASGLELLPPTDPHVSAFTDLINAGGSLPPVLLVKGSTKHGTPLTIADGYHRTVASFYADPHADITAQIASA